MIGHLRSRFFIVHMYVLRIMEKGIDSNFHYSSSFLIRDATWFRRTYRRYVQYVRRGICIRILVCL